MTAELLRATSGGGGTGDCQHRGGGGGSHPLWQWAPGAPSLEEATSRDHPTHGLVGVGVTCPRCALARGLDPGGAGGSPPGLGDWLGVAVSPPLSRVLPERRVPGSGRARAPRAPRRPRSAVSAPGARRRSAVSGRSARRSARVRGRCGAGHFSAARLAAAPARPAPMQAIKCVVVGDG